MATFICDVPLSVPVRVVHAKYTFRWSAGSESVTRVLSTGLCPPTVETHALLAPEPHGLPSMVSVSGGFGYELNVTDSFGVFSSNFFQPDVLPSLLARSPSVMLDQPVDCCTTFVTPPPPHSVYLRTSLQDELLMFASEPPQLPALLFQVVPELMPLVRCSSVVEFVQDHEWIRSALNTAPSTCLPRHCEVSKSNSDRYTMFCGSLVNPTLRCPARS